MNLITYFSRQSCLLLTLSAGCAIISGLAGAVLADILGKGVGGQHSGDLAGVFFGACLVLLVSRTAAELALLHLTQDTIRRLRVSLSRKVLATPALRLQELGKPGLLAVLTKDVDIFIQAFAVVPAACSNAILIVACFTYLAWLSWPLFLILTACLIVGLCGFHLAERQPLRLMKDIRGHVDILYRNFRDLVDGSRELQLNEERAAVFMDDVVVPGAEGFRQSFVRTMTGYTWVLNVGAILSYLVIGALLFVIPQEFPQKPAMLATVAVVLLYLIRPISDMMGALPALRQASIALGRMLQLDGALEEQPSRPLAPDPFAGPSSVLIELQDVVHHYPGDREDSRFKLGPINLRVHRAEVLFVVGGNGSGKTTLAMLLVGLYQSESGCIRVNGVAMDASNNHHYRRYFAAVFADFHLFEQLLSAAPDLAQRATRYIAALGMSHKVKVVNGKLSTLNLSTGQRKRMALVSSYLEDRPVYLFDEWAADQDPAFKRVFYTELLPELKAAGKTVIVITHDDAYFGCADRIVRLEEGRLEEMASPVPIRCESSPRWINRTGS